MHINAYRCGTMLYRKKKKNKIPKSSSFVRHIKCIYFIACQDNLQ